MPLTIESSKPEPSVTDLGERRIRRGTIRDRGRRLRIGLVNNMPDAALQATERQFASLLEDSSGEFDVRLVLVNLDTLPREPGVREAIAGVYRAPDALRARRPDAILVTGAEPRAHELSDEPFWSELTALIDWARRGTISSLYSCLAAHVAALHLGGVARRRRSAKLSGVFASEAVAAHELTRGLEGGFVIPHSRYNGLDEADLVAAGFKALTRSPEAGVDLFVNEGRSLEVFLQGHPEYDADTLAREYRRDLLRFLADPSRTQPAPPENYLAPETEARIASLIARARPAHGDALLQALRPELLAPAAAAWRSTGIRLIGNWLDIIARRKAASSPPTFAVARWGG